MLCVHIVNSSHDAYQIFLPSPDLDGKIANILEKMKAFSKEQWTRCAVSLISSSSSKHCSEEQKVYRAIAVSALSIPISAGRTLTGAGSDTPISAEMLRQDHYHKTIYSQSKKPTEREVTRYCNYIVHMHQKVASAAGSPSTFQGATINKILLTCATSLVKEPEERTKMLEELVNM